MGWATFWVIFSQTHLVALRLRLEKASFSIQLLLALHSPSISCFNRFNLIRTEDTKDSCAIDNSHA
jgi:hypothetical protein